MRHILDITNKCFHKVVTVKIYRGTDVGTSYLRMENLFMYITYLVSRIYSS